MGVFPDMGHCIAEHSAVVHVLGIPVPGRINFTAGRRFSVTLTLDEARVFIDQLKARFREVEGFQGGLPGVRGNIE